MSFSISLWFALPLLAAGLWLAYGLYVRSALALRWRWILGTLTILAWLALAGLILQPLWLVAGAVYHPATIAIAVDESPSYAAGMQLHSEEAVQKSLDAVRKLYLARGFRVQDLSFTSLVSLRGYLDSLAIPNLKAVFVWTDGRWNFDAEENVNNWPAPVFPVSVPSELSGEVQGENVEADFPDPDSGAEVLVEWRTLDQAGRGASLELRSGSKVLWKENLPNPEAVSGTLLRHRFRLPARLLSDGGEKLTARVIPEKKSDDVTEKNDEVEFHIRGLHRKRQVFVRPVNSLEERGLMDALFASDSMEAVATAPESLQTALSSGGVLWARESFSSQAVASAKKSGAPLILYTVPGEPVGRSSSFTSSARVTWREDAQGFLPGGVLSLGDLGLGTSPWELARPDSSYEAIAWAEQEGNRGVLFSRRKTSPIPIFEFALPHLWSARFSPGADERVLRLQERWVQGIAEWARLKGGRVPVAASKAQPSARAALDEEMSRIGVDEEALSRLGISTQGNELHAVSDESLFLKSLPDLPRGQTEELHSKSHPLFPIGVATISVIALLCAAWALRKKLHLD